MPVGGGVKRCFDLTIALATLIVMAPTMLLAAAMIYLTMGRPIFFVQQRVGFGRKMFGCYKFRTMVADANEKLAAYLAQNPEAAAMWREKQKLIHDPRITWIGHVLRKSSLDELPQLFNVLAGHMSCIGPRPVLADELRRYGRHDRVYAKARPGLTGMWQISGRTNTTYSHRVLCDCYYIRRWSLRLDMAILFKTVPAVMRFDEAA
jgi:exopolysaccharide production protein ExoY